MVFRLWDPGKKDCCTQWSQKREVNDRPDLTHQCTVLGSALLQGDPEPDG